MSEHRTPSSRAELALIERRLRSFSVRRRHLWNAALGYRLATAAAWVCAVSIPLLGGWLGLAAVDAALSLGVGLALVALAWLGWRRMERFRMFMREAFHFESLEGGLDSRLVSALDFLQRGESAPLIEALIARALSDTERKPELKLEPSERNRWRRRFAVAATVLIVVAANPWCGLTRAMATVSQAWRTVYEYFFPVRFEMQPAQQVTIARIGDSVEVSLRLIPRRHAEATALVSRDDRAETLVLVPDEFDRFATSLTSAVEAEYNVVFTAGERRFPERKIVFTSAPELLGMQTELIYPAYTRLVPRNLEGIQTRLAALPSTRMTVGFAFSKTLESASIEWEDGETLPLDVVGRFATVSFIHSQERRGTMRVVDSHGLSPDNAHVIDFALQRDEAPRLFVPGHLGDDMPMIESAVGLFGFGVRADDDFGVVKCVLIWRRSTVDDPSRIVSEGRIERLISPSQLRVVTAFEQIFEGMPLAPGDRIGFEVIAFDNRTPDAQITRSRPMSFFVHQEPLGGLSADDLQFGGGLSALRGRIPRSRRSTTVPPPDGMRTVGTLAVDWDAPIETSVVAPAVRGEHGQAARDYFRLLSDVVFEEDKPGQNR